MKLDSIEKFGIARTDFIDFCRIAINSFKKKIRINC
jgi:hypothetical protein